MIGLTSNLAASLGFLSFPDFSQMTSGLGIQNWSMFSLSLRMKWTPRSFAFHSSLESLSPILELVCWVKEILKGVRQSEVRIWEAEIGSSRRSPYSSTSQNVLPLNECNGLVPRNVSGTVAVLGHHSHPVGREFSHGTHINIIRKTILPTIREEQDRAKEG